MNGFSATNSQIQKAGPLGFEPRICGLAGHHDIRTSSRALISSSSVSINTLLITVGGRGVPVFPDAKSRVFDAEIPSLISSGAY